MAGDDAGISFLSSPSYVTTSLLPSDEYRWNYNAPGTGLTLTYGFMTTMPWYAQWNGGNNPDWFGNEWGTFVPFTAAQQAAVHSVVQKYEDVCNVDFVYQANGDSATVRFGSAAMSPDQAAHAYYPQRSATGDWEGDVWFNTSAPDTINQAPGSYGYFVTLHEIGHTLGLKHPHDWQNGGTTLPYAEDSRQYTVMSYQGHPNYDIEPSSLLLYDIAALQYLYGANMATRSGDTTYSWAANEQFISCIWDGGGIDVINASNQTRRVVIDLNAGSFSSLGSNAGGDAVDNLSIAFNCVIENANGGAGNDTLTGNAVANRLDGGAGADALRGGDGDDTLLGGAGDDLLYGDLGADAFDGGSGVDTVYYSFFAVSGVTVNLANPGAGTGVAQGDTFVNVERIFGTSYADTFIGDAGANWFVGDYGDDIFYGSGGADRFDGGNGTNTVSYENSASAVSVNLWTGAVSGGDAEGDILVSLQNVVGPRPFYGTIQYAIGSAFDDTLIGDGTFSRLTGGAGNDTLSGSAAGDGGGFLAGGTGNDIYYTGNYYGLLIENVGEGFDEVRATGDITIGQAEIEKVVYVGSGNFRGTGNAFANTIVGGAGNDTLDGRGGADTLIGNAGNDTLIGGGGADTLIGGDGDDVLHFVSGAGSLTLDGGAGFDVVEFFGSSLDLEDSGHTFIGIERINGHQDLGDTLKGNSLDNVFFGNGGNDSIDGRGGHDAAIYRGRAEDYDVTVMNGVTTVTPRRQFLRYVDGVDTLVNVEDIQFTGQFVNLAPVIQASAALVVRNGTQSMLGYFSATDEDGGLSYQVRELTPGAGYLTLDGNVVPVGQATQMITQADYSRLQYHAGAGLSDIDQFEVRAFDGVAWSSWTTITLTPTNLAPRLGLNSLFFSNQPLPSGTRTLAAAGIITAIDDDGDTVTRYRVWDSTQGNGYFRFNGVAQATNQVLEVSAAQFAAVEYVVSNNPGTFDYVHFQAYDGRDWSGVATAQARAPSNVAPIVSTGDLTPARGTPAIAASSMFSVSDADGDTLTLFEFLDSSGGNGYFRGDGNYYGAQVLVTAAQLASFEFVVAATPGAYDVLSVRAYDGMEWSVWKSLTVTAPANAAPVASASNRVAGRGQSAIAAATLFSATDGDGDAIARFAFWDSTSGNGSFRVDGVAQADNRRIEIAAADLAGVQFALGTAGTSDSLRVAAYDGISWGAWQNFTVTAPVNRAPTVTVSNLSPAHGTVSLAASSLFSVSDADGDAMAQYWFYDGTVGNGRLKLNGAYLAERTPLTPISAAGLANLEFETSGAGPNLLWVQAYDGMTWSEWKSFNVNAVPNVAPVVNVRTITPGRNDTSIAGSDLWTSITDADGDAMTQYWFYDGTVGNGRLRLNGVDLAERTPLTPISAADLANLEFRTSGDGPNLLWVQAYDGTAWSEWKSFNVNAVANAAPVVNVRTITPGRSDTSIAGADLWTSITDADGDAMVQYRFYDGTAGNGRLWLNGAALAEKQPLNPIDAADLANLEFRTSSTGPDILWAQAYDGRSWSAWERFTVNALANTAPTLAAINRSAARNSVVAATDLFTPAQDADGDAIVLYRFWDSTTTAGSGSFRVNGEIKAAKTAVDIMASQLASIQFVAGSMPGTDLLWVTAYDGVSWSQSKSLQLTTLAQS